MKNYTREQAREELKYLNNLKKCLDLTNKSIEFRMSMLDIGLEYLKKTGFSERADRLKMHYLTEQKIFEKGIIKINQKYISNPEKLERFVEYQQLLHPDIQTYFSKFSEQKVLIDSMIAGYIGEQVFQDILFYISNNKIDTVEAKSAADDVRREFEKSIREQKGLAMVRLDRDEPLKSHFMIRATIGTHFLRNYSLFNIDDTFEVSNFHPKKYINTETLENLLNKEKYTSDEKYGGIRQTVKLKNDKQGKVKSILKLEDDKIFLKYLSIGLFGNKKDIVLKMDPNENHRILHIEKDHMQIKNYRDGENKLFLGDELQTPGLVEFELSKFNDMELFYKNGKINMAAIGGEGLLYTVEFIMKNYDKILQIGKNE